MKHLWFSISFFTSIIAPVAFGASIDDLKMLYSNDFNFSKRPPSHRNSVTVHSSFQMRGRSRADREDLIYAVVRDRLVRNSIRVVPGSDAYFKSFKNSVDAYNAGTRPNVKIGAKQLLQPRLFAHFAALEQTSPKLFRLEGYIAFLGYTFEDGNTQMGTPELVWHQSVNIRDLSEGEVHEKMVVILRRVMDDFVTTYRTWRDQERSMSWGSGGGVITATYHRRSLPNLNEEIEDLPTVPRPQVKESVTTMSPPVQNRYLQLGASVGTPAKGNLHAGIWGMGRLPAVFHLSGMYYSPESRGGQLDAGWIFDREGSYQQSVSASLAFFNETREEKNRYTNNRSSGTTQVVHIREFKPFVGLTYVAQWGPVRLQAGPSLRVGPGNDQSFRFLIQAGFVPLIPF